MTRDFPRRVPRRLLATQVVFVSAVCFGANPATPQNPAAPRKTSIADKRAGVLKTSDGKTCYGKIYTTPGKPLKLFVRKEKRYRPLDFSKIVRIDVQPEKEAYEDIWRWKEGGCDEKVSTGNCYPWRKCITRVTLVGKKGKTYVLEGDMSATIYVQLSEKNKFGRYIVKRFVLHKRQKGPTGATIKALIYVQSIDFHPQKPASKKPVSRKTTFPKTNAHPKKTSHSQSP